MVVVRAARMAVRHVGGRVSIASLITIEIGKWLFFERREKVVASHMELLFALLWHITFIKFTWCTKW